VPRHLSHRRNDADSLTKFTQIIDYYLSDEGKVHLPEIHRLAQENTPESDDKLMHYAMEGIRLNGTFGSYRESHTHTTINDGGREVNIKPGDRIFVSFVSLSALSLTPEIRFIIADTVKKTGERSSGPEHLPEPERSAP
jgi:hypothetical protein